MLLSLIFMGQQYFLWYYAWVSSLLKYSSMRHWVFCLSFWSRWYIVVPTYSPGLHSFVVSLQFHYNFHLYVGLKRAFEIPPINPLFHISSTSLLSKNPKISQILLKVLHSCSFNDCYTKHLFLAWNDLQGWCTVKQKSNPKISHSATYLSLYGYSLRFASIEREYADIIVICKWGTV